MEIQSANFGFLRPHDPQIVKLAALAEQFFHSDSNTCIIKLRQYAERLAKLIAANTGLYQSADEAQVELLKRLKLENVISKEVADLFHLIRIAGNKAVHNKSNTDTNQALTLLQTAQQLGIWFHRTFSDRNFKSKAFIAPTDTTAQQNAELKAKIEELEKIITDTQIANQHPTTKQTAAIIERGEAASKTIDLNEAQTRALIDQQLRDRGWEVDTQNLRYSQGFRPTEGKNLAISEYPTNDGIADYALFIGLRCVAMIEAKRRRKNVMDAIAQAERYAKGYSPHPPAPSPKGRGGGNSGSVFPQGEGQDGRNSGSPLPEGEGLGVRAEVPFVFATNGRGYLKQLETESGIWFRDTRKSTNHSRALIDFYTPDGLEALLTMDRETAHEDLKNTSFNFGFDLYPHQRAAIEKIEEALEKDQRSMLVAMATGTGKTKLAIALLYRLLSTKRFRRVCFVVDRSALGNQTADEFTSTKVVTTKTFTDIFGLKGLKDIDPESETKVHICTIQGLVKRILYAKENGDIPPIDQYDLILIDECHRGYLLDREMSDSELSFRNQEDYISKYRRVLEHFDAVKIGLTATPALHTKAIFGEPIYTYGYREAVIDGILIDHEPPIQIRTKLSEIGISFAANEEISRYNTVTGAIDLSSTPDELNFDVEKFNKQVITESFNQAIALELTARIDPLTDEKTLIFAANDRHADLVVECLKKAMQGRYEELENDAIQKLTGSVDDVQSKIRAFRNDSLPRIAVTVDLLTTGIDVPKICNLVFLRRVNSRILYEQMIGRATRRCNEIGKQVFKIYDAVDIYKQMQEVSDMKPVIVNPQISLEQLFDELIQVGDPQHQTEIRDQILVKMRQKITRMGDQAKGNYETQSGEPPASSLANFKTMTTTEMIEWVRSRPYLGKIWEWKPNYEGTWIPISEHEDQVIAVTRGYGEGKKPQDFLDSFTDYVRNNVNQIAALTVVLQRPRELTRAQLRELRRELDLKGYSEVYLQQAWRDTKNEDIAASIIGFVRQAAIGDPLMPYEDRVKGAIRRILKKRPWTDMQRKWLNRIGEQIIKEVVVDREALEQGNFQRDGGFKRLNRDFDGQLEQILGDINEEMWLKQA